MQSILIVETAVSMSHLSWIKRERLGSLGEGPFLMSPSPPLLAPSTIRNAGWGQIALEKISLRIIFFQEAA